MRLTVKLDYACRALVCLAKRHASGEILRIEEMAKEEDIPVSYLAQILGELRNGGLVASKRGKLGGYSLARGPDAITLYDVIALVQGDVFAPATSPAGASGRLVASAWQRMLSASEEVARSTTLGELIASAESKMYYI